MKLRTFNGHAERGIERDGDHAGPDLGPGWKLPLLSRRCASQKLASSQHFFPGKVETQRKRPI
jgi:hypothetical protein